MKPASLITATTAAAALALSAPAVAAVPHTVEPGETLWSIAAASNLTTRALAASNGLPETANVVIGSTIQIPSESEAAAALGGAPPGQGGTGAPAQPAASSSGAPTALGAYTVKPGDTLSGIAARSGASAQQIAWMNGLDPAAPLLYGTALKLPNGASGSGSTSPHAPHRVAPASPQPSPGRTDAATISQIAAQHGVPGSLASAIAWQESGFNNGMVSSANARGVMQVMPGTWDWVQQNLADSPLDPSSPNDNVRAGVLYLKQLLQDTGGDENQAIAAYYQGLGSVRQIGMYDDTKQYVNNVQSLRSRFGGR